MSFSTGDNKDVKISIDGTALSAESTRGVLGRSKFLSELVAGTEESAISLLLEASVHLDLPEANCTLPVLPGAFRAWTDFGSGEHQSLDALADVVQVRVLVLSGYVCVRTLTYPTGSFRCPCSALSQTV